MKKHELIFTDKKTGMKTRLIMLPTPIIVNDEEIGTSWYIDDSYAVRKSVTTDIEYWAARKDYQKVIAGIPELPQIDWNGLESEFGYVDVEKLAKLHRVNISSTWSKDSFIEGFKAAQQLNDKMFSLDDMFKCFKAGMLHQEEGCILQPNAHGYIQSLQPQTFDIEIEKVTNGKIKIIKNLRNMPR